MEEYPSLISSKSLDHRYFRDKDWVGVGYDRLCAGIVHLGKQNKGMMRVVGVCAVEARAVNTAIAPTTCEEDAPKKRFIPKWD
jgi:hypothetical protein